jgi:ribose 1,5-bisphosphate isomerase
MTEKELQQLIQDIKDLKIQGNTNIAKSAAKGILEYITHAKAENFSEFVGKVKDYAMQLANARPNEPLAYNAMTFLLKDISESDTQQQIRIKAIERIENFFKYLDESFEIIRLNAVNLLKGHTTFMTDCHSSLARDTLIRINELHPQMRVINTETRPLYQGHITATKLAEAGVEVIHIIDSAVASFILDKRYPTPEVIIVGSDGITLNGSLVNKVGTYNLALAAAEAGIPFYVVTQSMKVDPRSANEEEFPIELRKPEEVWPDAPKGVEIINPAFDLVPAKFITGGYITEKGLMRPEEFKAIMA